MKPLRYILLAALLVIPSNALGRPQQAPTIVSSLIGDTGVNACDLTGVCQTNPINVEGFSLALIRIAATRGGLYDDVGFSCEESDDKVAWSLITSISGTVVTQFAAAFPTTSTVTYTIRPDITGFIWIRCAITANAAAAGDVVTVTGRLVRGL